MSLLMDALKKAEEAKRLAAEGNGTAAPATKPELTLKPMVSSARSYPAGSSLPDLSLHIDSVDADLAAVSTEAPVRRRPPESTSKPPSADHHDATERTAVRNVFTAKEPPKSRSGLWFLLGLTALAALGIGAYFWWQLQSVSVSSLARPAQPQAMAPTAPVQAPVLTLAEAAKPAPEIMPTPTPLARQAAQSPARPTERSARPATPPANAPPADPDSPIRVSKNQPKPNQTLERAYDSLQRGQLDEAQRGYEQVLRSDAKSTDALLGLATIAALQGQTERAQVYYLHALESDPNDPTAQAGVISTRGQADPGQSESRLKTALASQPDSSALHFALGNLYARQLRWSEAQQAYFRAYSIEPDNADFIFNMAVSLDHLHQNKLAAQYYQMALNATGETRASFDRNQAKARVLELQP